MVAQKRGRGAKAQAAKTKAVAEEQVQEAEMTEAAEATEENNGQAEPAEQAEENADATMEEQNEAGENANATEQKAEAKADAAEAKVEAKPEVKVEPGKLLVENLPSSFLFDYQEKLKELFSKHGEILSIKRGPIIVTELTTTPTLSAIVEFKNKDSLEKALSEEGTVLDGSPIAVAVEGRSDTAVLVGVPHEATTDYVRLLFSQCGDVASIHEFGKLKHKILRVTFHDKESVEKALRLDRELRINGFLVTVNKYRDDDDKANPNQNKNKRQHPSNNQNQNRPQPPPQPNNVNRNNNFRPPPRAPAFNARPNFRGGRGGRGGFPVRGGFGPRGFAPPVQPYMPPPQPFMGRPGGFMDGQRPNKRLRQM